MAKKSIFDEAAYEKSIGAIPETESFDSPNNQAEWKSALPPVISPVETAIRSASIPLTFGVRPYAEAAGHSLFGGTFGDNLNAVQTRDRQSENQNPGVALGSNFAAQALPFMAVRKAVGKAVTGVGEVAKDTIANGLLGMNQGFTAPADNTNDRLMNTLGYGAASAGGGYLLGHAVNGVNSAADATSRFFSGEGLYNETKSQVPDIIDLAHDRTKANFSAYVQNNSATPKVTPGVQAKIDQRQRILDNSDPSTLTGIDANLYQQQLKKETGVVMKNLGISNNIANQVGPVDPDTIHRMLLQKMVDNPTSNSATGSIATGLFGSMAGGTLGSMFGPVGTGLGASAGPILAGVANYARPKFNQAAAKNAMKFIDNPPAEEDMGTASGVPTLSALGGVGQPQGGAFGLGPDGKPYVNRMFAPRQEPVQGNRWIGVEGGNPWGNPSDQEWNQLTDAGIVNPNASTRAAQFAPTTNNTFSPGQAVQPVVENGFVRGTAPISDAFRRANKKESGAWTPFSSSDGEVGGPNSPLRQTMADLNKTDENNIFTQPAQAQPAQANLLTGQYEPAPEVGDTLRSLLNNFDTGGVNKLDPNKPFYVSDLINQVKSGNQLPDNLGDYKHNLLTSPIQQENTAWRNTQASGAPMTNNNIPTVPTESNALDPVAQAQVGQRLIVTNPGMQRNTDTLLDLAKRSDPNTYAHAVHTGGVAETIANMMGLPPTTSQGIATSSIYHDLGKMDIPTSLIHGSGKPTEAEFNAIKTHPELGSQLLGGDNAINSATSSMAGAHHEQWNGMGYPNGLSGNDIPLESRIGAIADVFSALASERSYKPATPLYSPPAAPGERPGFSIVGQLQAGRGKHFDPTIVDTLLNNPDEMQRMYDAAPKYIRSDE